MPVWHASVANGWPVGEWTRPIRRRARRLAAKALAGVGGKPEWFEFGDRAFHLRRRATPAEVLIIGEARDIRGTPEYQERVDVVMGEVTPMQAAFLRQMEDLQR